MALQVKSAKEMRERIRTHMDALLGDDGILIVPSAPGPAPVLNTAQDRLATYRKNMLSLTSIAGLAGLPQVRALLGSTSCAGQSSSRPCISGFTVRRAQAAAGRL